LGVTFGVLNAFVEEIIPQRMHVPISSSKSFGFNE